MDAQLGVLAIVGLLGYLLGSIPTGYIVVKSLARKNIREWGTGNIGTLNTLRATNSKPLTLLTPGGRCPQGRAGYGGGPCHDQRRGP